MHRREMFKSAAAAALGSAALLSAAPQATAANSGAKVRRSGPFVETADGVQLFVRDWGVGAPLVFLAGWTLTSDVWGYQMAPLADEGFRCIAYDRRGHGRSSDPGRGFDYDALADDLAAVLDALDVRSVTLIAHSMAGGEVVRYLSRHGSKRVARIVFVGATLPFLTKTADNPDGIDPAIFEQGRASVLAKGLPAVLEANLRPFVLPDTPQPTLEWIRAMMLQSSLKAAIDCNRALTSTDFRAELPKITAPALVVHGDRDASAPLPLTASKLAKLARKATLRIYEGAPHGLMLTHAARLNRDIAEFARS